METKYKQNKYEEERAKLLERRKVTTHYVPIDVSRLQLWTNQRHNSWLVKVRHWNGLLVWLTILKMLGSAFSIVYQLKMKKYGYVTFKMHSQSKQIHQKVLEVAETLGVSKSLMRIIERRQFVDKFILYGGMLLTLTVIFLLYNYIR